MMARFRCTRRIVLLAALLSVVPAAFGFDIAGKFTGLDRYVQTPDPAYRYELVKTTRGKGYTAYVINMTSQQWRSPAEVDHPVWKHWLTIVKPDHVKWSTGFLFITGGSIDEPAPSKVDSFLTDTAVTTSSVVTELRGIPNEPLTFSDETKSRTEDEIIAYTWVKFLETGDETWPLRNPMVKAAARAMDTVTAFCGSAAGGSVKVDHFVVSGASKRGWTTWITTAVDRRVVAEIPIVIDVLNVVKSMEHHYQAYGFYSPAVKDYVDMGLMNVSHTTEYRELMRLVDPYSYLDRYTMPKFIINSAGDQYFLPDSWRFYYRDLPGEKHLRYVPNTDHSLKNSDVRQSIIAFYDAFLRGVQRPHYDWTLENNGDIRVETTDKPSVVKLWEATNPKARDFRLMEIGAAYRSTVLTDQGGGVYVAHVRKPATGWTAAFVELTFPSGGKYPFKFTTGVRVVPDTLPFPPPQPSGHLTN